MKNKLVLFNVIILTVAILAIFFSGLSVARDERIDEAKKEIVDVANIYAANYNENIAENVPSHIRLTIVDATGVAIKDSQSADAIGVQHLDREEIQNALKGTPAVVTRYSDTLKKDMAYYAVKVNVGDNYVFVRAAIAVESVQGYVQKSIVVMVCVLIGVLLLSYLASVAVSMSILKPLKDVKTNLEAVKNGSYVPSIPSSSDKEINAILVEINDISEKLRDSMLRESDDKQKLDYILDNISDGIVVLNKDGDILSINKNACAVFDLKDVVGKKHTVLTADKGFSAHVSDCLENGTSCDFEYASDGKFYMVSARALENEMEVLVLSDITAIKTSEKTRSEFFANASHELKTPLMAIQGYAEGIQTGVLPTKESAGIILEESDRMTTLIEELLALSKIDSAQTKFDFKPTDFVDIVRSVVCSLAPTFENSQKQLATELCEEAIVSCDEKQMRKAISNLISNAFKFCKSAVLSKCTVENHKVVLTISDDGEGIAKEDVLHIFDRFYTGKNGNTGIGLALTKEIVKLHGGDVKAYNRNGAVFEMILPQAKTSVNC